MIAFSSLVRNFGLRVKRNFLGEAAKGNSGDRERGAVAVEFALLTPIFLLILGLLVDFSRIGFVQISLNSAAREGVRSSSFGLTNSEITSVAVSSSGGAAGIAQLLTNASLSVNQVRSCSASTTLGRTTEVVVSTPFNWVTPIELFGFIGGSNSSVQSFTITARGVMVCAG